MWLQHWKGERGWNMRSGDRINYTLRGKVCFLVVSRLLLSLIVGVYGSFGAKKEYYSFDSGYSYLFLFGIGFTHGWKCSLEWPHFTVLSNNITWTKQKFTSKGSECDLYGLWLVDFYLHIFLKLVSFQGLFFVDITSSWKQGKKNSLKLGHEIKSAFHWKVQGNVSTLSARMMADTSD